VAGAFRIAEGYVEVTADETRYDEAIRRLKAGKHQVKVGVNLDDKSALAQLAKLTRTRGLKVNVDLAGMAAFASLAEKTRNRTTKIKVDLDTATVLTKLAEVTRERSVKVRIDLDQTPMAQLSSRTYSAQIIAMINEPAYQRAAKRLDKLTADRNIIIRPQVDTRVAADELRNLTRRQRVRIGVDVDTRVAADDIANLTRRRTLSVVANANTTEARARIDSLSRNRTMDIDVRTRGGGLAALTSIGSSSSSSSSGLKSLTGSLTSLTSVIITAAPTVLSLGESLIQMGPAAAVAAPALLSLVSIFAAIKIGTSGIGAAFKAAFAPAAAGAKAAASSAHAVENAQRSLAKAVQAEKDAEVNAAAARVKAARDVADAQQNLKNTVRDVADANHQAAESVASAERDLTAAQKAARQAQLDLTQARKDAAAELQDLSNQLTDSQLSERQDVLNLADAEAQLAKDKAAGAAVSAEQLAKDQLARDQAAQALMEQQLQTQRLTDQNAAATKAGVEGSGQVVAAKQGVVDANQAVADKTQAAADVEAAANKTQVDGAQQLAKARRDLADAQAAQVKAATDGARQIADAQDAVIQAGQAVADAQSSGAAATNKLADAMAKLSPNARAFVNAVVALRPAWTALKLGVQDALFRGLAGSFTAMAHGALPALRAGLSSTAGVLNLMAKNAMTAVTNLAKTGQLKGMFASLNEGLKPLARIPGQFITALAQLSIAAAPAFKRLTTAAAKAADSVMKKLSAALASGSLTDGINRAIDVAKLFGHVLGDAFGILSNVMKAAGGDALGTIGALLKEFRKVTAMPEVQAAMKNIFGMINAFAKLLSGAVGTVFAQLVLAFGKIAPSVTTMLNSLGNIAPLLGGILLATNPILGLFVLLAPVIGQLIGPIVGIVNALGPVLKMVSSLFGLFAPVFAELLPPIQILITALGGALKPIVAALGPVLLAVGGAVGALMTAIAPLLPIIGQMIGALGPVLTPILNIIGMLFTALGPVLLQLGKSLLPPFLKITTTLAGVFKQLQPVLGAALDQLGSKGLVPIVAALGVVIGDLVTKSADQFVSMFEMLLPIIPVLIPVVVQLAQSLAQILLSIAPLLPQIMLLSAQLLTQLLPAVLPLLPVLAQMEIAFLNLVTGTITGVVMPVLTALIDFMGSLLTKLQPAIDAITTVTKAIAAAFQWLYDFLLGHSIIPDIVNGTIAWFTQLWTKAKDIFNALKRDVAAIWSSLWTALRNAWASFWSGISSSFNAARTWIGNTFSSIRTSVSNTWSGLWNGVSSTFGTIINTVNTKIGNFAAGAKKAFTNLRDTLGTIWSGIQNKFASPVRFLVGTVYNNGIRKMWDTIASKVGLPQLPEIKLGFNTGGVVPGTGTKDTVPAKLTPGERVLSLSQVAQLGGHRGIDAMLGKDHPTGTGGNPTSAQEKKTRQPVPAFGLGGIVAKITDTASGALSWAKNLVVGGLKAAAQKAIAAMVQPLINRIPGAGSIGGLLKGMAGQSLKGILGWMGDQDKKAVGGPAVQKGLSWARSQAGKPYQWAGNGNPSWDCSGLMSAIESVIRGESPHRRWATGAFSGSTAPPGWVHNLQSPFMIGITNAGVGHTAGTIGGVNAESRGGDGIVTGSRARGWNNRLFTDHYGFQPATKYDQGGLLAKGATMAVNKTGRPERVLSAEHTAALDALLGGSGGGGVTIEAINVSGTFDFSSPADRRRAANELVDEMREAIRLRENSQRRAGKRR
jgi:phage-related protein